MPRRWRAFVDRLLAHRKARVASLPIRSQDSSPFAAGSAIERVLRARGAERAARGHELADRMRALEPRAWLRIHADLRAPDLESEDVAVLAQWPRDDAVELCGVATYSASGYAREAALDALRGLGHARALPYVLLRLGDWVEQVRRAAAATLRSLLDAQAVAELIEHHRLVERLRRVVRVDLGALEAEIRAHLAAPASRSALEAGLAAKAVTTRLFCLRVLEGELARRPDLVERALRDPDPTLRWWIAAKVARGDVGIDEQAFEALLRDPSARVGSLVIRALSPEQIVLHRATLVELAVADARTVRESARYTLRGATPFDFARDCRARLAGCEARAVRPGWIAGLGETGDARDFERLRSFLEHRRARVRAAAASALGRIDPERAAAEVAPLLADPSGPVRRAALGALARGESDAWYAQAYEILARGAETAQSAALAALAARGGWDAVPGLLHALASSSESVRTRAWQRVTGWMRRYGSSGWSAPSAECRGAIARIWPRVRQRDDAPEWAAQAWRDLQERIERATKR